MNYGVRWKSPQNNTFYHLSNKIELKVYPPVKKQYGGLCKDVMKDDV